MAAVESGSSGAEHSSMAGAHLECRLISISPRTACRNFWRERNLDPRFRWSCSSGWVGDWGWELILILALDFVATFLSIRVLFFEKIISDVWHLQQNQSVIVWALFRFRCLILSSLSLSHRAVDQTFLFTVFTPKDLADFDSSYGKMPNMYLKKDGIQLIWA